ncbi:putative inositol oxygenase isoform X2 [Primulina tabacum]|uniref:putative inositol oxygenase isoform X2 n=1 Tax=Primulina tabacum TaxID=48773 RepID=UPI003F5A274A
MSSINLQHLHSKTMISAANLASASSFSWGNMIPFPPISPHSLNMKSTLITPISSAGNHSSGVETEVQQKVVSETDHLNAGIEVPIRNSYGNSFRDYEAGSERKESVAEIYLLNHLNQTYDFVMGMREIYGKLDRIEMSIWECCELLNQVVDESDPDLDAPQIQHLLQAAEAIRKDYPNQDWLHLTALIHDLGKVLLLPSFGGLPQWAVVGDTFPLGCAFDESIIHYQVAKENNTTLPSAALFVIRYHSFYSLHGSGAYGHLMNEEDFENLKWLQIFNKYDLYSKSNVNIDVEKVKPYYISLIQKYFPSKLKW